MEALRTIEEEGKDYFGNEICVCSSEFRGCKWRGYTSDCGDKWPEGWAQFVSGHIHKNQKLGTNI